MPVNVQKVQHPDYGTCISLDNGAAELLVTVDYGPRILHFTLSGEKNMLLYDKSIGLGGDTEAYDRTFYPGARFHFHGGHRLWVSPEAFPDTSYPDNDPVDYEINGNTVTLTCKPQCHNNVQYRFAISMDDTAPAVTIVHKVTNVADKPKTFAPWGITVMDRGGLEIMPMNIKDTGLLANRTISVWPYTDLSCVRSHFTDRYFTLRQNPEITRAFKLGFDNEAGWACYVNHGLVFIKRYNHVVGGSYPDNGCSYETYTNNNILEMESLGEIKEYAPGETAEHTEHWALSRASREPDPKDEASIEAFIKEYVG